MSVDLTGARSEATPFTFVFPVGGGRWEVRMGVTSFVDGHLHKISLPGFETRSGEGFGISAVVHVLQNPLAGPDGTYGDVLMLTWANGRLMAKELVASGVVILGWPPQPVA